MHNTHHSVSTMIYFAALELCDDADVDAASLAVAASAAPAGVDEEVVTATSAAAASAAGAACALESFSSPLFLVAVLVTSRALCINGITPPWAIVTFPNSRLSSSSFRIAKLM